MEERIIDVRPYFLEDEHTAVNGQIRDPPLVGFRERPLLVRVVQIGYACERTRSHHFAEVEGPIAIIGTRDKDARNRVSHPFAKLALA